MAWQILLDQSQELLQAELWQIVCDLANADLETFHTTTLTRFLSAVPWLDAERAKAIAASITRRDGGGAALAVDRATLSQLLSDVRCIRPAPVSQSRLTMFGTS